MTKTCVFTNDILKFQLSICKYNFVLDDGQDHFSKFGIVSFYSQFTKQANVTTQLAENTLETNFLSIENLQVSKFCKPKGTIPNFWKSLLNSSCFFESEIKLN